MPEDNDDKGNNDPGMYSIEFWKKTLDRVIKTGCQAVLLFLTAGQAAQDSAPKFNAWVFDWSHMGGIFVGGCIVSLLTCIVSAPFGKKKGDPSLT